MGTVYSKKDAKRIVLIKKCVANVQVKKRIIVRRQIEDMLANREFTKQY